MLKIAVFAPIPNANVSTATSANVGLRDTKRSAYRMSVSKPPMRIYFLPALGTLSLEHQDMTPDCEDSRPAGMQPETPDARVQARSREPLAGDLSTRFSQDALAHFNSFPTSTRICATREKSLAEAGAALELLEARVAAQRIVHGIGFEAGGQAAALRASLLERRNPLVLLVEAGISDAQQRDGIHVGCVAGLLELAKGFPRLGLLAGAAIDVGLVCGDPGPFAVAPPLIEAGQRFRVLAGFDVGPNNHVGAGRGGLDIEHGLEAGDGAVVLARVVVDGAIVGGDDGGKRIELSGALAFCQRFGKAALICQALGQPVMRSGVVGIELDGAAIFLLGGLPVPVVVLRDEREGGVPLSKRVVERTRLERGCARLRHVDAGGRVAVAAEDGVSIREPGIGAGVVRIASDGLLKPGDRAAEALRSALAPQVAALEIEIEGLVFRRRRKRGARGGGDGLAVAERELNFVRNFAGDLALHGEQVVGGMVEAARPDVGLVVGLDKLGGDAHLVLVAAHAALEHVLHAEIPGNLPHGHMSALVIHDRGAGDDGEMIGVKPADLGDHLLGDAVAEVVLADVAGEVLEGEHGEPQLALGSGGVLRRPFAPDEEA